MSEIIYKVLHGNSIHRRVHANRKKIRVNDVVKVVNTDGSIDNYIVVSGGGCYKCCLSDTNMCVRSKEGVCVLYSHNTERKAVHFERPSDILEVL